MGNAAPSIDSQIFNMKYASRVFEKQSKKAEKEQKKEMTKVKKAMEAGNNDIARVYAENAIRHKNQALNLLKLSARLDAVAQRLQTAQNMNQKKTNSQSVTRTLGVTMQNMNVEKQSLTMETFEKQMEDMDVQLGVMEQSLQMSVVATTPEMQVEDLMKQVAEEHGLEMEGELSSIGVGKSKLQESKKQDISDLEARLAKLNSEQ